MELPELKPYAIEAIAGTIAMIVGAWRFKIWLDSRTLETHSKHLDTKSEFMDQMSGSYVRMFKRQEDEIRALQISTRECEEFRKADLGKIHRLKEFRKSDLDKIHRLQSQNKKQESRIKSLEQSVDACERRDKQNIALASEQQLQINELTRRLGAMECSGN